MNVLTQEQLGGNNSNIKAADATKNSVCERQQGRNEGLSGSDGNEGVMLHPAWWQGADRNAIWFKHGQGSDHVETSSNFAARWDPPPQKKKQRNSRGASVGVQQRLVSHSVTLTAPPPSAGQSEAVTRQTSGESEAAPVCEMSVENEEQREGKTKNKTKSRNKLLAVDGREREAKQITPRCRALFFPITSSITNFNWLQKKKHIYTSDWN